MRQIIASLIRKTGYELHRCDRYPLGRLPFRDINYILDNPKTPCCFDVGANVGQTLKEILSWWPGARVHCFEPTPETYAELSEVAAGCPNVKAEPLALGREPGERVFHVYANVSTMNSFLAIGRDYHATELRSLPVKIDTLDAYCTRESVDHIDLLKIDTQGFDMEVIAGGEAMVGSGKVTMILVELDFASYYEGQAAPGQLIDQLIGRDYLPVCFYPMALAEGRGYWCDALFLHRSRTIPG